MEKKETEKIKIKITTASNLFIGGLPGSFEIGGVDLFTITDYNNLPFIPASSFKGTLRKMVKDYIEMHDTDMIQIGEGYKEYLSSVWELNKKQIFAVGDKIEKDRITKMNNRFEEMISGASAEYLFGIQGFNNSPKLIFNDFVLEAGANTAELFSIDAKNSIITTEEKGVESNPRIYKTVRPGITFTGEISFYRIDLLKVNGIKEFISEMILEFNEGIYRLGNSGSRGYGKIRTEII